MKTKIRVLMKIVGLVLVFLGTGVYKLWADSGNGTIKMEIRFPVLTYNYSALEPFIDAKTVEIHYDRHFRNYYNNFIASLLKSGNQETDVVSIMKNISHYSLAIRNNGGGFYNHALYFENMTSENISMPDSLKYLIVRDFGSVDEFQRQFVAAAKGIFGSGWAWLCSDKEGKLFITTTPNQDNPLMDVVKENGIPLLALDVWEHAYYLKYQNKRSEYIDAFWKIINWNIVWQRYTGR